MEGNGNLERLFRLSIALGTTLDLSYETSAFMDWLVKEVGPASAALFIADEAKRELQLVQARGFEMPSDARLPLGLDLWRWLGERGVSVPDEGDPRRYAVPILIEKQLFGTLCVISKLPVGESIFEEQKLVETAAGYLSTVLRNIWRYRMVEQQVAERTAALEGASKNLQDEIAERKRAEEALAWEQYLLHTLLDNIPDHVYFKDTESRFVRISRALAHWFGLSDPAQALGKTDFDFFTEEHARQAYEDEQRIIRTGRPLVGMEEKETWPDGRETWVSTTKVPLRDREGNIIGTFGISRNITEHKRMEEALAEERNLLRTLIDSMPDLICVKDDEGRFIIANIAAARLMGAKTPDEVLGKTDFDFYPRELAERCRADEQEVIRSGRPLIDREELLIDRTTGRERWLLITKVPLRDSEGKIVGIVGIGRDITDRKRLEEQFLQSQKMEAIGRLAGGIAHDFNNLLTAILGYAQLVLEGLEADSPLRGDVEEIKKAGERTSSLTRQLLAFSRKQILQPQVLNLNELILGMEKMVKHLIGEDIEFIISLDPELGRTKADPGQIGQVIMNLIVNARDAMPRGGKLTIETSNVYLDEEYARGHVGTRPGHYVMISVSDTGVGMSDEVKSHIFEPFFTTKERGKGTGLGLSTVYGIVKQHGGNIWVYSELGRGTTFKVYFPRVEGTVELSKRGEAPIESLRGMETVLLVEDEDVVRELARRSLLHYGYTVLEARRPEEALQICEQHEGSIHLLVTDVVMPGMSGRELAERLASLRPETKVLYMSGYADNVIVHYGVLDLGAPFLQKPFAPEALARKVREVLDRT
ncbi:MAG: PAS domain-containing protein [bacterium]